MTTHKTTGFDDKGACWIVENSGPRRSVFGPFGSISSARQHAGARYTIVRGSGLFDGDTFAEGSLANKFATRSIYAVDGSDL
jgi:hypothetical protein